MSGSVSLRSRVAMVVALAFFVPCAVVSAATDPAVACAAAKQKAAFKLMNTLGKCLVKAVKNQETLGNECVSKASTKFGDAFVKAEAKGGCVTTSDADSIENMVNGYALSIIAKLPTTPPTTTTLPQYTCGGTSGSCSGTCPPGANCNGGGGGPGAPCSCNF